MDFNERQRELCLLSSFVSDHKKWLESVLEELNWSKDSLQAGGDLVRCPYNEHHYVPPKSLETHRNKCFYASKGVDLEESGPLGRSCQDSSSSVIEIDSSTEKAVLVCAKDPDLYKEKEKPLTQSQGESLEDSVGSGLQTSSLQPHQIISYIKSWKKVPLDWVEVSPSSLDLGQLKGWLFRHLPREHAHSSSVGGEIVAVDTIVSCLQQPGDSSVTPNRLLGGLKPLLGNNTGPFVLSLWKQVFISRTQSEGGISDSMVEDIAPMPLAQLLTLQRGTVLTEREEAPLVYHKVKELSQLAVSVPGDDLPLPMDAVFYTHTPTERRVMYDYVVEAGQVKRPKKEKKIDPDLYRDDEAALKAKLKALAQQEQSSGGQETKSFQEILRERKEKRDYKRRRQKYRAKNVHITRRKTSEIFRDIINNRMGEIMESFGPQASEATDCQSHGSSTEHASKDQKSHDSETRHQDSDWYRRTRRDKESERGRRRSRSKSRERHGHPHKKHKKHKSHKHSTSREHKRERFRSD